MRPGEKRRGIPHGRAETAEKRESARLPEQQGDDRLSPEPHRAQNPVSFVAPDASSRSEHHEPPTARTTAETRARLAELPTAACAFHHLPDRATWRRSARRLSDDLLHRAVSQSAATSKKVTAGLLPATGRRRWSYDHSVLLLLVGWTPRGRPPPGHRPPALYRAAAASEPSKTSPFLDMRPWTFHHGRAAHASVGGNPIHNEFLPGRRQRSGRTALRIPIFPSSLSTGSCRGPHLQPGMLDLGPAERCRETSESRSVRGVIRMFAPYRSSMSVTPPICAVSVQKGDERFGPEEDPQPGEHCTGLPAEEAFHASLRMFIRKLLCAFRRRHRPFRAK